MIMAQSGQYNYRRCLQHGETGAAQLAVAEFVRHTMQAVFLLNRKYRPFYKWAFRAMRELPLLGTLSEPLEYLLTTENADDIAKAKAEIIEDISILIIDEAKKQKLSSATGYELETHAYSVNDAITDPQIRNLHVMYAVN